MRLLQTDDNGSLRGEILLKAFEEDIAKGLIPTYVGVTKSKYVIFERGNSNEGDFRYARLWVRRVPAPSTI